MDSLVQKMLLHLNRFGLNHWGVVTAEVYEHGAKPGLKIAEIAPGTKSILVVGNAGPAFWDVFSADLKQNPEHLRDHDDPVDAFVSRSIERASRTIAHVPHRWIQSTHDAPVHLDFRTLAVDAGLGAPSRLGLVIHPKFGPWMALRAACFLPMPLPKSDPIRDLCSGCSAPCVDACPGSAFLDGQWDVQQCVKFHRESNECDQSCASRMACPVGADMAYPAIQRRYHYNRKKGRRELAQVLEIEDDLRVGSGPLWGV